MLTYKHIYRDLLNERNRLERRLDTLSNAQKERYSLDCKNIENIKNPVSFTFMDKVLFVKKESISLDKLSHCSDYFFLDGTSVFLWYSALVDYYIEGHMKEEEELAFLDMYKCSLKEESFSSSLLYFQMVMHLVNKESFCQLLGIKLYLYRDFYYNRLDKKVLEKIKRNLSHLDLSSFSCVQQREIKNFLSVLEEKTLQQMSATPITIMEVPQKLDSYQQKINEIIEYIQVHKVSVIPNDVYFSDGSYLMREWYYALLRSKRIIKYPSLKEVQKRGLFQVAKELYNKNTIPLHEGIPFDYGSCLRRVLTLYCLDSEQVVAAFKIPNIYMVQIMENKLVPTEDFILTVLRFLNHLPISDVYEKEFVEEAIQVYENLESLHLTGDTLSFVFYPKEEEDKYFALWKNFDSAILAQVRTNNYDWYLKCLTYLYICKIKRRKPNTEDYFYDASSCYRWLTTQKSVLSGKRKFMLKEEQKAMLKVVLEEAQLINDRKSAKEEVIIKNVASFIDAIENSFSTYGEILPDLSFEEIKLRDAWRMINQFLKQKEVPFLEEYIYRIKELRWKMIAKKKSNLNHFDTINFGYEISRFADGLHLTINSLMELFSFSRSTIIHYLLNISLPSQEHTKKMLFVLDGLDLSLYRKDQVEDIECFKKVLFSFCQYLQADKSFEKETFSPNIISFTGELLRDISISDLKEIYDTDIAWYEAFKKVYKNMWAEREDDSSFQLPICSWFRTEAQKMSLYNYSSVKTKLLHYLYFLYEKKEQERKENRFMHKFIMLSNFIYEQKRIPIKKELLFFDNTDGRKFYYMILDTIHNNKNLYGYLSYALLEQMKILVQYVAFCQRKRFDCEKDKIQEEKFFLGERLENIRICLGFSKGNFLVKLGWDKKEFFLLYKNKIFLREQHIDDLLQLFEEMKNKNLRKDQLEEMQDFIQVLTTKQLDDNFALKFTPKE